MDKEELEAAFRAFTQSITHYGQEDRQMIIPIAVDGKTLRHNFDHFEDQKAMQKLMFFDTEQSLILGHMAIVQLKDNQPTLLEDVPCLIKTQVPCDVHKQKPHSGHGRITNRTTMIYQQNLTDFIIHYRR